MAAPVSPPRSPRSASTATTDSTASSPEHSTAPSSPGPRQSLEEGAPDSMETITPPGSLAPVPSTASNVAAVLPDDNGLSTLRAGVALVNLNAKSHSETEIVAALSTAVDRTESASAIPHPPPLFPRATAPAGVPTLAPTKSGYTRPSGQVPGKGLRMGVRGGLMGTGELKIPPSIQAKMAAVSLFLTKQPSCIVFLSSYSYLSFITTDGCTIILYFIRPSGWRATSLHSSNHFRTQFSSLFLWINESTDNGNGRRQGRGSGGRDEKEATGINIECDERYCGWIKRVDVSLEWRRDGWRSWIHATGGRWNALQ